MMRIGSTCSWPGAPVVKWRSTHLLDFHTGFAHVSHGLGLVLSGVGVQNARDLGPALKDNEFECNILNLNYISFQLQANFEQSAAAGRRPVSHPGEFERILQERAAPSERRLSGGPFVLKESFPVGLLAWSPSRLAGAHHLQIVTRLQAIPTRTWLCPCPDS
jgi:hypothetical protein